MRVVFIIFVTAFVANSEAINILDEIIERINKLPTTWRAGRNFHPETPRAYLRGLAGVHPNFKQYRSPEFVSATKYKNKKIPESFDAREQWPDCPSIQRILDQSSCGSCWAFAAAEVMSDRYCIHSNGTKKVQISTEDLLSCCKYCGDSCNGGYPGMAWKYYVSHGIVTGGSYNSNEGCKPYSISPCGQHGDQEYPACVLQPSPLCERSCRESYPISYNEDKQFGKTYYSLPNDVHLIQEEILNNGPVQASYTVYEDFYSYKSGVYKHEVGDIVGYHSVKIIGWGVEEDTPYWLISNSWGTEFGENGYFKILRGSNESNIEESLEAGVPKYK